MEGFFVKCLITVWLVNPATGKDIPHSVEATCKRSSAEVFLLNTGSPETFYIDCTDDLSWLETSTSLKTSASEEDCNV